MNKNKEVYQLQKEVINDLTKMNVGNMMLFKSEETSVEGPVFYIKETNNNISNIIIRKAQHLKVQLKDTIINGVYSNPLIIMVRLNDDDNYIYGQWFNKYNNTDRELMKEIVFQDKLNFCIVNVNSRVYVRFGCKNIYRVSVWNYFKILKDDKRWSQEMFESEVAAINSILRIKVNLYI